MEYLNETLAREAVAKVMRHAFVVPMTGTRVNRATIDWELIRRNDYDDKVIYRTALGEGGVLLGGFVGHGEVNP
jgi:hypothetical protein